MHNTDLDFTQIDDISRSLKHKLGQVSMDAKKGKVEKALASIDHLVEALEDWKRSLQRQLVKPLQSTEKAEENDQSTDCERLQEVQIEVHLASTKKICAKDGDVLKFHYIAKSLPKLQVK